ncbi:MAG: transposase [Cyanobacteria bacterium P01_A01_bin.123]
MSEPQPPYHHPVQLMKAYSSDLRSRIVKTYESETISQRALAQRFCVATSFVQKILKQYRETGSLAPKPHGGGHRAKLNGAQELILAELVEAKNDATLLELAELLAERTQLSVSPATVS